MKHIFELVEIQIWSDIFIRVCLNCFQTTKVATSWPGKINMHAQQSNVAGGLIFVMRLHLTLKASIATKVLCFSRLLKCLRSLYCKQWGPISDCGAVFSGSTLFASILNSSVMLGNYLQQTTSADDIFRCIFSWHFKG